MSASIDVDLILNKLAEETDKASAQAKKAYDVMLEDLDTEIAQTPYEVVFEEDSLSRQSVEMGGGVARIAVGGETGRPQRVDEYEDEVGRSLRRRRRAAR